MAWPGLPDWKSGSVCGRRRDPQRHHRSRQGLRPRPGRLARLCDQHARIRLDTLAAPGGVYRRQDEGLSGVAAGKTATKPRPARRQLRLEQYRRLLYLAYELGYGTFIKFDMISSARKHCRRWKANRTARGDVCLEQPGVTKVFQSMFEPGRTPTKSSICRCRLRSSSFDKVMSAGKAGRRLDVRRLHLQ